MSRLDAAAAESLFDRASRHFDGPPARLDERQQAPFDGSVENFRAAARKLDRAHRQQLLLDYSAAAFKTAIDIQPDYDFGNNNLGVYYARRGQPEDLKLAEKYFRAAVTINRRYADAFNNLGIVLSLEGKFDEAIECHRKGLEIFDRRASDHNNLARVYLKRRDLEVQKGETDKAKADLDDALEELLIAQRCDLTFLPAWLTWIEIFIKQKNVNEAARCVQRMIDIDGKSPATLQGQLQLAKCYLDLKRPDDAIAGLTAILEIAKSLPEVYNARGTAYLQKGDLQHALEDFEQVLHLAPQYPGVQERILDVRERLGNPKK